MMIHSFMSSFLKTAILSILSILIVHSDLHAQSGRMKFQRGEIDVGSSIYGGFLKDRDGFLWIGSTGKGLHRWDGYELKNYKPGPDSVSGAMINAIVEDDDGVIWIGTFSEGVTKYDKKTGKFTHYKHTPGNPNSISCNNIPFNTQALYVDRGGAAWVGTDGGGLNRFDKMTNVWTRYRHDPDNPDSISDDTIMAILEDTAGFLWAGGKNGLNRLDPKTKTWKRYQRDPDDIHGLNDNWIYSLMEDRDGILWIGTKEGGLNKFDKKTGRFVHYTVDAANPYAICDNNVWSIFEDSSGKIWVCHSASKVAGLELFDKKTERFTRYAHHPDDPYSVSGNIVTRVHEDPETGIFRVINGNGIIDKYDRNDRRFTVWSHDPKNADTIGDNAVLAIWEDRKGVVWVGCANGGLNRLDREKGAFTHYFPDSKDPTTIPHVYINSFLEDGAGNFWIGSYDGTLSLFDRETGACVKHYKNDPDDPGSITKNQILKYIIEDKDDPDILWLGTFAGGMDRFNKRLETFTHYKHDPLDPGSIANNIIPMIRDDGRGALWLTTYGGGLDRFDKRTGVFKHYKHDPDDPGSVNSNTLYEIFEDSSGNTWVTGKGGLSKFHEKSETFKNYTRAHGFPSDLISNLLQDDDGNLWLGSVDAGLIRFDPISESARVYTKSDGLSGNTFFWQSRLKTRDGNLWFGGANGMVSFDPKTITDNRFVPPIALTSFKQGGKEMDLGAAPEKVKQITLDWKANFFEFQFAALNYSRPEKNRYAYWLEGWDKEWYYAGANPFGRYSGLQGGEYTLRLKGSNNDGLWNEEGVSIRITVVPPFWRRWWFYTLIGLGVVAAAMFVSHYMARLNTEAAERRRAEDEARESEKKYKEIFNSFNDIFFRTDMEGRIRIISPSVQALLGYTPSELTGRPLSRLYADPGRGEAFLKLPAKKGDAGERLDPLKAKDGSKVWMATIARFYRDEEGNVLGVQGVSRDVTERQRAEADRTRLEKQLRHAKKMEAIGTLAGGVAHDFNNILSAIIGYSELALLDAEEGVSNAEQLKQILKASNRAKNLVKQILTFSRGRQVALKPMNINKAVKRTVKLIEKTIPKMIRIDLRLSNDVKPIKGDDNQLEQVMMNMCANSADAMPDGGRLVVETGNVVLDENYSRDHLEAPQGEYVRLTVSDTGCGMTDETLTQIFDPFFTTKEVGQGTGLGLSTAFGIVKGHGGRITCYSEPGAGATFKLYFPALAGKAPAPVHETGTRAKEARGSETVLLVDDERSLRRIGRDILTRQGYHVLLADSGEEALEIFGEKRSDIDLVVLDVGMPGMGGGKCLEELLKMNPGIRVIIASGYSLNGQLTDILAKDPAGFIEKPYTRSIMLKIIRETLDAPTGKANPA